MFVREKEPAVLWLIGSLCSENWGARPVSPIMECESDPARLLEGLSGSAELLASRAAERSWRGQRHGGALRGAEAIRHSLPRASQLRTAGPYPPHSGKASGSEAPARAVPGALCGTVSGSAPGDLGTRLFLTGICELALQAASGWVVRPIPGLKRVCTLSPAWSAPERGA